MTETCRMIRDHEGLAVHYVPICMSFSSERFTMFLQLAVRKMAAPRSANLSNNSKSQDGNPATEISRVLVRRTGEGLSEGCYLNRRLRLASGGDATQSH